MGQIDAVLLEQVRQVIERQKEDRQRQNEDREHIERVSGSLEETTRNLIVLKGQFTSLTGDFDRFRTFWRTAGLMIAGGLLTFMLGAIARVVGAA